MRRFAGDDVQHVLVIGGFDAPRRRRRGARPRRAEPGPATVELTRATVIDATPLGELEAAGAWLERAAAEDAVVHEALGVLNRALAGYRLASADPWLPDADPARAVALRVGYGTGEQVAEGEWEAAQELPRPDPRGSRSLLLSPQERLAELLGGRDAALACEELALRARGDLDHGRRREAALQLVVALDAGLAELEVWREHGDVAARLEELAAAQPGVAAAAESALEGGLDGEACAVVERALGRLEAALRARRVAGGAP